MQDFRECVQKTRRLLKQFHSLQATLANLQDDLAALEQMARLENDSEKFSKQVYDQFMAEEEPKIRWNAIGGIPIVAHRKNNVDWLITMRAEDWFKIYREWEAGRKEDKE